MKRVVMKVLVLTALALVTIGCTTSKLYRGTPKKGKMPCPIKDC
jgi:hypothetical protein